MITKTTHNGFPMTPLSRIIHQLAKIILHRNIFYISSLVITKCLDLPEHQLKHTMFHTAAGVEIKASSKEFCFTRILGST